MVHKKLVLLSGLILLFLLIASINFVSSAPSAPTNVHFENNITSWFDEGNFSINWTARVGGDTVVSYSVLYLL